MQPSKTGVSTSENPETYQCPSLQRSAELVKTVASGYDEYVSVKDLSEKINRALTAAKKDNDFIYHDRVPEVKDLEQIGKAALVKATTITPPLSQKFAGEIDETFDAIWRITGKTGLYA